MKINEIAATTELSSITSRWADDIIDRSKYLLTINGEKLFHYYDSLDDFDLYYLIDANRNLLSYVGTGKVIDGYTQLLRLENVCKKPGLIYYLVKGLIALGFKFFIAADEKLTIDGFGWLKKLILLKSFLVTDQTGKMPDAASLDNEWLHSLDSDGGESGPTKIFIENKTLNCEKILSECKLWDSRGLLMPFFNDYSNDLLP